MKIANKTLADTIKEQIGNGFFYCLFQKKNGDYREALCRFGVKNYKSVIDGEQKTIGDRVSPITVSNTGICVKEFQNKEYQKNQKKKHDFTSIRYDSIRLLKFKGVMYRVECMENDMIRLLALQQIPQELEKFVKLLYKSSSFGYGIGDLPQKGKQNESNNK